MHRNIWHDISTPTIFITDDESIAPILSCFNMGYSYKRSILSTRNGNSVNVSCIERLIPHCHTTHTESIAHISKHLFNHNSSQYNWISKIPVIMKALMITVNPKRITNTKEWLQHQEMTCTYDLDNDWVICSESLYLDQESHDIQALIIHCSWTIESRIRDYSGKNPPYFTPKAMKTIVSMFPKVDHLLVDLPSIEREDSGNQVFNHRIFFRADDPLFLSLDTHHDIESELKANQFLNRTITENCYINDLPITKGLFWLNLQLSNMQNCDAVPSRPMICLL